MGSQYCDAALDAESLVRHGFEAVRSSRLTSAGTSNGDTFATLRVASAADRWWLLRDSLVSLVVIVVISIDSGSGIVVVITRARVRPLWCSRRATLVPVIPVPKHTLSQESKSWAHYLYRWRPPVICLLPQYPPDDPIVRLNPIFGVVPELIHGLCLNASLVVDTQDFSLPGGLVDLCSTTALAL